VTDIEEGAAPIGTLGTDLIVDLGGAHGALRLAKIATPNGNDIVVRAPVDP
jgi:hypothetical protein